MRCVSWPATFAYLSPNLFSYCHSRESGNPDLSSRKQVFTEKEESGFPIKSGMTELTEDVNHIIKGRYYDEILVPPIAPPPAPNNDEIEKGIFVTITGIPGLERLYQDAKRLGLKLYSNDTDAVPGSTYMSPHVISNKNIVCQFARAGWSSIWISMISGTPLVVPDFDGNDDPEIYFNNKSVEDLGLGIVYRGQGLEEILEHVSCMKASCENIKRQILNKWGTLDGNHYCAEMFVKDFLLKNTAHIK